MKIKISITLDNKTSDVSRILEKVTAKSHFYNLATPSKIVLHNSFGIPEATITVEEVANS